MNQFSISQLARYSGVKPHTIRIWEQRYKALRPDRSEGNTRYYDSEQLRRLLNIVSLNAKGYRISVLGSMSDEELFSLIGEHEKENRGDRPDEFFVTQLISAGMDFDESHFEYIFSQCLSKYGMRDAYVQVIHPMLNRMGLLWASNTIPPAREHFMSNILRQKISAAIDALPPAKEDESWLLFSPENEFHEIGLLFAHYLIKSAGKKVYYLGSNLPSESLTGAVEEISPTKLMFFLVHYDLPEHYQNYLIELEKSFSEKKMYISGNKELIDKLRLGKNTKHLPAVPDLEKELQTISQDSLIQ